MRLPFTNSIARKAIMLSSIGIIASVFLLITGLFALHVMDKLLALEEAFHEHTMMHFESLDHLKQYIYEGDEKEYEKFKEIRIQCKNISNAFAMADSSMTDDEINQALDDLGPLLGSMTVQEGKDQVMLGRRFKSDARMKAMIEACVRSTESENRILDVMQRYHDNPDPEFRKSLRPEIDDAIEGLHQAKKNFANAIAELSHWTSSKVRLVFIVAFAVFFVLTWVLSYFTGKAIVGPILRAIIFAKRVSQGGMDRRITIETNDETKDLANALNAICDALAALAKKVMDGSAMLTESAQDLSATANQFAATATETSASVSEINVTARELQQAVQTSTENADSVAEYAEHSATVYETGKKATDEMGNGMAKISDKVMDVGERIANLSAQAIRIAEIIDMVDEVAHQSELLSVNASIEAAKAGEFGRGFQVVAAEVKTLSEQSKGATRQVRTILKEIQKATEAAATAAEQSAQSVQEGLELNKQASDSMTRLADSFEGAVAFTRKIASTSRQELQGVSQVTNALADIQGATQQNTAGARLMESRSRELVDLAEALKKMMENIKI